MKNLKRVLSLGLASVMLLGMMVVGASAKDFTDAEDIVHTEAVQTMVALKIINGKEDGSFFDPKGEVTRAEMAKMIAVLMNGGSEANTGVKTTPSFTDIGGHWAEGWIEYCADMQIINGRGDGTFDPNGNVTGTEALKMVLTALGYNADAYGLVGASWAAQTIERARATQPVKLVEELTDVVLTAPATRDVAAQMIWNGLQAGAVTTTPDQNKSNGEITWTYGSAGATLLKQRYDADIVKGEYKSNYDMDSSSCDEGEIAVFDGTKTHKVPSDLSIDNIGEEIKIVYRDSSTKGTKGQADAKDTIYGVFNTGATRVVKSQLSKVKDAKDDKAEINVDGTKYACEDTVKVVTNFVGEGSSVAAKTSGSDVGKEKNSALTTALKYNSGNPIKLTFSEDGKVEKIYVTESYIGQVTSINSTNIVIAGNSAKVNCNLKIADNDVEEGLKKGDIVSLTTLYAALGSDGAKTTVKKAEKVTGELVSGKKDETLTLDNGKSYKLSYKDGTQTGKTAAEYKLLEGVSIDDGDLVVEFAFADNSQIGETFDLYLVNGYVLAAVQTSEKANNYSVITEVKDGTAGSTFSGLQLQVLTADGTKEIITVSKDSANVKGAAGTIDKDDYGVGDIITYTFNKDNEAEVTVEKAFGDAAEMKYDDKAKTLAGDATAADCVVFVQTKADVTWTAGEDKAAGASWKVYKIRDLKETTWNVMNAVATDKDDVVVAVSVNAQGKPKGASEGTVYALITSYDRREEDFWVFTAMANGESYTIKSEDNLSVLNKGKLVKFSPTANDEYGKGDVEEVTNGKIALDTGDTLIEKGYVRSYNANDNTVRIWVGAPVKDSDNVYKYDDEAVSKTYAIDKDAQIIYVDMKDTKSDAEGTINAFSAMDGFANVTYILDSKNVIQVMFVETSGKKSI